MGLLRTVRRGVTWASLGLAGGALVITTRHLLDTPQPLTSALPGDAHIDRKHGGDVYYNVTGPADAEPLVLLHDFYTGASNYEFRMLAPELAKSYRVFAPDWLGYGMSERAPLAYTGEFYADMLLGFLRDVVTRPAIVLAHGRAANIAVRAASDAPDVVSRLVLVAPYVHAGLSDEPTAIQTLVRATQRVSLGMVPYAVLASRPALRWNANSRSTRGASDEETLQHRFASAHQVGGHHAELALLTGELDLPIQNAFALLEPPVLILSGASDSAHPHEAMEDLAVLNPYADLDVISDAGAPVFLDQPTAFAQAVTSWLSRPLARHGAEASAQLAGSADEDDSRIAGAGATSADSAATSETPAASSITDVGSKVGTDVTADGEALFGTPGYTVPGVSDMGLDGASAVPFGMSGNEPEASLTTADAAGGDEATTPANATSATTLDADSPAALLPEAGDARPLDAAEHAARESTDPPIAPVTNISVPPAAATPSVSTSTAARATSVTRPRSARDTRSMRAATKTTTTEADMQGAQDVAAQPSAAAQTADASLLDGEPTLPNLRAASRGRRASTSTPDRTTRPLTQPSGSRSDSRRASGSSSNSASRNARAQSSTRGEGTSSEHTSDDESGQSRRGPNSGQSHRRHNHHRNDK